MAKKKLAVNDLPKTTIRLDPKLLLKAKIYAATNHIHLQTMFVEGLKMYLKAKRS